MQKYDIAFYGIAFFLIGIALSSISINTSLIVITTALLAVVFLVFGQPSKRNYWLAGLTALILVGSLYYQIDDRRLKNIDLPIGGYTQVKGVVINEPETRLNSKRFTAELMKPHTGRILVYSDRYEDINYGDLLLIDGEIRKPASGGYGKYLAKDRISGVIVFAEISRVATHQGSKFKAALFKLKAKALDIFRRALPSEKAAFMSGITLGERADFSEKFKEAMSLSGTTHLVALSGYNVTIIAWAVAGMFGYFLRRRLSFILTVLVIIGFVLMTGADASIVRAAIMGIIVLLAHQSMRIYSFRNAIAVTAFVMVLVNPKVLLYDIGFQLSFLALLGIIYLKPAIVSLMRMSEDPGFLSWRDNALTTVSAQLAVIPLLLTNFGQFSLMAFPANILILEAIPITMLLGFIMVAAGIISFSLASMIGWLANILLSYELALIRLFAGFDLFLIQVKNLGILAMLLYFLLLTLFIAHMRKKKVILPS